MGGATVDEQSYQTSLTAMTFFTAGGRVWVCGDCGVWCCVLNVVCVCVCVVSLSAGSSRVFSSLFDNRFL